MMDLILIENQFTIIFHIVSKINFFIKIKFFIFKQNLLNI